MTLYLDQRICMHKLSLLEAIIHVSLASKALLKSFAFQNPKPPFLMGWHNLSQAFQARNFPSFSLGFHQNFLVIASILSHIMLGTLKEDRVLLPAYDKHLLLHPKSFDSSFSRRNLKSLEGDLDRCRGAPRYISSFFRLFIWSTLLTSLWLWDGFFFEKTHQICLYLTADLSKSSIFLDTD